jgi:hypothetical protein
MAYGSGKKADIRDWMAHVANMAHDPGRNLQQATHLGALLAEGQVQFGKITKGFDVAEKLNKFSKRMTAFSMGAGAVGTVGGLYAGLAGMGAMGATATAAGVLAGPLLIAGAGAFYGGMAVVGALKMYSKYREAAAERAANSTLDTLRRGARFSGAPQEMDERQAADFSAGGKWKSWSNEKILGFQLSQPRVCIPFGRVMEAAEKVLGRPVHEFEFTDRKKLMGELIEATAKHTVGHKAAMA